MNTNIKIFNNYEDFYKYLNNLIISYESKNNYILDFIEIFETNKIIPDNKSINILLDKINYLDNYCIESILSNYNYKIIYEIIGIFIIYGLKVNEELVIKLLQKCISIKNIDNHINFHNPNTINNISEKIYESCIKKCFFHII